MLKTAMAMTAIVLSMSASAHSSAVDNYAISAIADARYNSAVTRLETKVKAMPADETALINLAVAYRHTGRGADATAAYRRVLMLENVELDTATGAPMWSHDVARAGLAMARVQTVASARP